MNSLKRSVVSLRSWDINVRDFSHMLLMLHVMFVMYKHIFEYTQLFSCSYDWMYGSLYWNSQTLFIHLQFGVVFALFLQVKQVRLAKSTNYIDLAKSNIFRIDLPGIVCMTNSSGLQE